MTDQNRPADDLHAEQKLGEALGDAQLDQLESLPAFSTIARAHRDADSAVASAMLSALPARGVFTVAAPPTDPLGDADGDGSDLDSAAATADFVTRDAPAHLPSLAPGEYSSPNLSGESLLTFSLKAPGSGQEPASGDRPAATSDYRLIDRVGKGGQGEVWRAWQECLHREVAVKKLIAGDPREFLSEAYTTAALDHPNIAPVHDLGRSALPAPGEVLSDDSPLIAMKLVRGTPWDAILRARGKSVASSTNGESPATEDADAWLVRQLGILVDVANAVAYAHARGVIHRDLKPSQVMVGDFGEVYLMDWGLAVWVDGDQQNVVPEEAYIRPGPGSVTSPAGTPAYMAPEQTDPTTVRLSPATDIYLLGAILYEILAGSPPHAAKSARAAFFRAAASDRDPLPGSAPTALVELVEQAMRTEPTERVGSAREFRDRIESYLSGAGRRRESQELTDSAREKLAGDEAPSRQHYKAYTDLRAQVDRALTLWPANPAAADVRQEVLRRHTEAAIGERDFALAETLAGALPDGSETRSGLEDRLRRAEAAAARRETQRRIATGAAFVLLVLLGIAFVLIEQRENQRTLAIERANAETSRAEAEAERATLFERAKRLQASEVALAEEFEQVFPLPADVSAASGATAEHAGDDTLALANEMVAQRNELNTERSSLIQAGVPLDPPPMWLSLGEANAELSTATTRDGWMRAVELYRGVAAKYPDAIEARVGEGVSLFLGGDRAAGIARLDEAVSHLDTSDDADPLRVARLTELVGSAYEVMDGDTTNAAPHYERGLALLEPRWAELSVQIGRQRRQLGQFEDALALTSSALTVLRKHESEATSVLAAQAEVAAALSQLFEFARAEEIQRDSLALAESALPDEPGQTVEQQIQLANTLTMRGAYDEAFALLEDAEAQSSGGDPSQQTRLDLAITSALLETSQVDDALARIEKTIERQSALLGEDHPQLAVLYGTLGQSLTMAARFEKAEAAYRKGLAIYDEKYSEGYPEASLIRASLATSMLLNGKTEGVIELAEQALAPLEDAYGDRARMAGDVYETLGLGLAMSGHPIEAREYLQRAIELREETLGFAHLRTANAYSNLAITYTDRYEHEEALRLQKLGLEAARQAFGDDHSIVSTLRSNLGVTLSYLDRNEEALELQLANYESRIRLFGVNHPEVFYSLVNIGDALIDLGRRDEAEALFRDAAARRAAFFGADAAATGHVLSRLAVLLEEQWPGERLEELVALRVRSYQIERLRKGDTHPDTINDASHLMTALSSARPQSDAAYLVARLQFDHLAAAMSKDELFATTWPAFVAFQRTRWDKYYDDRERPMMHALVLHVLERHVMPPDAERWSMRNIARLGLRCLSVLTSGQAGVSPHPDEITEDERPVARKSLLQIAFIQGLLGIEEPVGETLWLAERLEIVDQVQAALDAGREAALEVIDANNTIAADEYRTRVEAVMGGSLDWREVYPDIVSWTVNDVWPPLEEIEDRAAALFEDILTDYPIDVASWPIADEPPIPPLEPLVQAVAEGTTEAAADGDAEGEATTSEEAHDDTKDASADASMDATAEDSAVDADATAPEDPSEEDATD